MAEENKEPNIFSKLLGKAATDSINMVVGGAGVIAVAAQYWAIGALGITAYAALVVWDVIDPEKRKKLLEKPKLSLPEASALTDPAAKAVVKGINKARFDLGQVMKETPDAVKDHLGTILSASAELEERAIGLLHRAEDLTKYLSTTSPDSIRQEVQSLAQKAKDARDATAKAEYTRAKTTREEQLNAVSDIEGAKDRVMAQLSRIQATLEGLPPKIVRMRVLDSQAMDALTGEVSSQLDQMNSEVQSFEETLVSLAQM
jgi:hypothetical protein